MQIVLKSVLISLILMATTVVFAQDQDFISGEAIVQLKPQTAKRVANYQLSPKLAHKYTINRALFPDLGIYLIEFDPAKSISSALRELSTENDFLYVQKNYKVSPRNTVPNDPFFQEQWHHKTIQSEEAWDITTGGQDQQGREIVIAIMDTGFDSEHEDFIENTWFNTDEIEDDNIDNDNNGYVDDYKGWNSRLRSDQHSGPGINGNTHGTNVAGMTGARGDNDAGITGVIWDVKLLFLSGLGSVAEIIEGYNYIAETRSEYNESNGTRGAYIVASNISLGVTNGRLEDFQSWCDVYDLVGQAGVLNVCAADNLDSDVELNGDIPTICTSDYLITVTNTDINNIKVEDAAFGVESVDIGAPGENILTTCPNDNYDFISGTSVSAPLVAGAIGLLYSSPCDYIAERSLTDPANTALDMKRIIFAGAQPSASLRGITTQGSVLNVFQSVETLQSNCGNSGDQDNAIRVIPNVVSNNDSAVIVEYSSFGEGDVHIRIFDAGGVLQLERKVGQTIFGTNSLVIPIQNTLSSGVYFVSLQFSDKTQLTEKLVVY